MRILKNIIIFFCIIMLVVSCDKLSKEFSLEGSCENDAKIFRELECLQVFEKLPFFSSPYMNSEGIHLITGEKMHMRR